MIAAQLGGLSRLDLPLILGTVVTPDPDRARAAGSIIHLLVGQAFALGYAAAFALLGQATWWLGGLLGTLHGAVALTVLVPMLVGVHPRMASERAGPASTAVLEPPGLLALNYGTQAAAGGHPSCRVALDVQRVLRSRRTGARGGPDLHAHREPLHAAGISPRAPRWVSRWD